MNKYAKGNVTIWNRLGINTFIQVELGWNYSPNLYGEYRRLLIYYSTLGEKLVLKEVEDDNDELFFDCEKYMEEQ